MDDRFDEIDERILFHLAREARHTSGPDIAAEVDVSAPTIRNRIARLEDAGVIRGYHAHIDYEAVGGRLTYLFTCSTPDLDRERFAQRVLRVPGVIHVGEIMAGREDLLVTAVGTDTDDVTRIADDLKAMGVDIEDEDLVHREHFRPYAPFGPDGDRASAPVHGVASLSGDANVVEVTVPADAPIAGRTLADAGDDGLIDAGVLVITIERDEETLTPQGRTEILAGDRVTILTRSGVSDGTLRAFTGDESDRAR